MPEQLGTGALISPKDERDWTLASVGAPTTYPDSCFIDQTALIPSMQGHIGCCVGCTGEEMIRQIFGIAEPLSFRFVYALAKSLEGTIGYTQFLRTATADDGTYPALVAQVIRKYGVPLAQYCPNDVTLSADAFCYNRDITQIPQEAFADALNRKSGADLDVPISEEGIKRAINYAKANGGGVMILREIDKAYWTDLMGNVTYAASSILPIRIPNPPTSGHEEYLYGYDTEPQTGRTRIYWLNHWDKNWADNGRGWEYLDVWLPFIKEVRCVVANTPTVQTFTYNFTKILRIGNQGPDVVALQHALAVDGEFTFPKWTGYFGTITQQAVMAFQRKYHVASEAEIIAANGQVGPKTLQALNNIYNK